MATLTISSTYQPSEDPIDVPLDGSLTIVVPTGGCTICLDADLGGKAKWDLTQNKTIDLKNHPNATITYDVLALNSACPPKAKRNAHSIQIGDGTH